MGQLCLGVSRVRSRAGRFRGAADVLGGWGILGLLSIVRFMYYFSLRALLSIP